MIFKAKDYVEGIMLKVVTNKKSKSNIEKRFELEGDSSPQTFFLKTTTFRMILRDIFRKKDPVKKNQEKNK